MADNPYAVYALDVPEASPAKRLSTRRILVWSTCVAAVVAVLIVQHFYPHARLLPASLDTLAPMTLLAVFLAALACEYVDSSMGMGYGTTLTPILLLFGFRAMDVVPCVLVSEFLTGLTAGLMHHRDGNVDLLRDKQVRLTTFLLSMLSTVGAVAAVTLASKMKSPTALSTVICFIILAVGVLTLATIHRRFRFRPSHIVLLGTVAAFNKGLSGGGYGPLVTSGQVVSGISPKQAVAITSLAESLTCLVGLIAYFMMQDSLNWALAVPLTVGAMLSVPIATLTVARLPENAMRAGVGIVTCILGFVALAKVFKIFG